MTRWFRQVAAASRTLPRAVWMWVYRKALSGAYSGKKKIKTDERTTINMVAL